MSCLHIVASHPSCDRMRGDRTNHWDSPPLCKLDLVPWSGHDWPSNNTWLHSFPRPADISPHPSSSTVCKLDLVSMSGREGQKTFLAAYISTTSRHFASSLITYNLQAGPRFKVWSREANQWLLAAFNSTTRRHFTSYPSWIRFLQAGLFSSSDRAAPSDDSLPHSFQQHADVSLTIHPPTPTLSKLDLVWA